MTTLYIRNDTSNNIANDKTANAADLDGEFDAIETGFANLEACMSITGVNADFQGTLGVTGVATLDSNLTVGGTLTVTGTSGYTGQATFANLVATTADINAGTVDAVIGGTTPAAGTFTTLTSTGGAVNGTVGATTPAAGTFTTLAANTSLTAATADINNGTVEAVIGGTTPKAGTFTTLAANTSLTAATADINGGTIDGAVIGGSSAAAGNFTTVTTTGAATVPRLIATNAGSAADPAVQLTAHTVCGFDSTSGGLIRSIVNADVVMSKSSTDLSLEGDTTQTITAEGGGVITFNASGGAEFTTLGYILLGANGQSFLYYPTAGTAQNVTTFRSDVGGAATNIANIKGNGDIVTATGSYGTISDIRVKENVVDASSQWEDIKNLRFVNYNKIGHPDDKHLGVIAQELLESGMTGLVGQDEEEDGGMYHVKYSILFMKAVKALQEAMQEIEELKVRVGALEQS